MPTRIHFSHQQSGYETSCRRLLGLSQPLMTSRWCWPERINYVLTMFIPLLTCTLFLSLTITLHIVHHSATMLQRRSCTILEEEDTHTQLPSFLSAELWVIRRERFHNYTLPYILAIPYNARKRVYFCFKGVLGHSRPLRGHVPPSPPPPPPPGSGTYSSNLLRVF